MGSFSKLIGGFLAASCVWQAAYARVLVESVQQAALKQQGWLATSAPEAKETIQLQVALKLKNLDFMIKELYAVSDPDSERYGQYYDRDELFNLVNPPPISQQQVLAWLQANNVAVKGMNGQQITIQLPVQDANALLNARFMNFEKDGVRKIRTVSYSVPGNVAQYIDIITPTTFFGETKAFAPVHMAMDEPTKTVEKRQAPAGRQSPSPVATPPAGAGPGASPAPPSNGTATVAAPPDPCTTSITPDCIRKFYNIGNYKPDPRSGSRMGFGSFLNQSARYEDLFLYEQEFGIPRQNFTKVFVNDAVNDQNPLTGDYGEANLDVQNMIGVAAPLPVVEYLTGGKPPFIPDLDLPTEANNTNEPYLPYYNYLLHQTNAQLPQVISNSYGEPEHTVPPKYAERVCYLIAMMGLRGISVFESSGDTGIGSNCQANDGSGLSQFNPQFPSTCPYITSVGGTESAFPEIAWRDSSGGFSYYFDRPFYQTRAITTYLNQRLAPQTLAYFRPFFNANGRGFPDISAHSLLPNYVIFGGGRKYPRGNGGTSAAAPVVAAIFALLNDARLRRNRPTMGFINPWLYKFGNNFVKDITGGGSRGCSGVNFQTGTKFQNSGIIPGAAWNATVGWDPVTGLGVLDFERMRSNALYLTNKKE